MIQATGARYDRAISRENVEIVRRGYQAIDEFLQDQRNVPPRLREFLDSEIEWHGPREFPDLAEPHHGYEGVQRYLETLLEAIEDYRMIPVEFIDAGADEVLVFARESGRGTGSGADVQTQPTGHLWKIREGRAVRMQSYWERSDALKAAGLEE